MLKNTKLRNELKELITSHPEVDDILVFGSYVKGKTTPEDIDIIIIFNKKVNKQVEYNIRKTFEKSYRNIAIISKTREALQDPSFDARESYLFEAKSLFTRQTLGEKYGFSSFGMYKYDFKNWNKLEKTKFYYALNGRGKSQGIINKLMGIKLSDRIVLIPLGNIEEFRAFLEGWNIEYKYVPILMPQRLSKKILLQ